MSPAEALEQAIAECLAPQLGDFEIARELALAVRKCALDWTAPTVPMREINSVIAFTFGNRMLPNGNRMPGPVNEHLADAAVALHLASGAPVFAQWEVAEAIGARVAATHLVPIFPGRDEQAEPAYLSTAEVLARIAAKRSPASLGVIGVVAFSDHISRCVQTARRLGFAAAAPEDLAMPSEYDALSGQPWCRSRLAYLLHDVMLRVTDRRAAELEAG